MNKKHPDKDAPGKDAPGPSGVWTLLDLFACTFICVPVWSRTWSCALCTLDVTRTLFDTIPRSFNWFLDLCSWTIYLDYSWTYLIRFYEVSTDSWTCVSELYVLAHGCLIWYDSTKFRLIPGLIYVLAHGCLIWYDSVKFQLIPGLV
jgi:hypothetical protein